MLAHLHARHQARRGHAGAAGGAVRDARGMGETGGDSGAACCAPGAATSKAPRRPTAMTSTCSTRCCVGSWPVELLGRLARCGGPRRLCRAHQGGADKVAARGQGALHLGGARSGLRGGDARPRADLPSTRPARPRFSEPSCPSPSASPGLARRTAWFRPC